MARAGMRFYTLVATAWLLVSGFPALAENGGGAPAPQVTVAQLAGEVEPALAAFVRRAVRVAEQNRSDLLAFEIDTFGGRVDAALEIADTILDSKVPTLSYVHPKAISAGALIALATRTLVMAPGSTLGDCAPITFTEEGPKMLGEKFQSPLRAKFRSLARRNNYPAVLAEAMVTPEMEVYRVRWGNEVRYLDKSAFDDLSPEERGRITSKETVVAAGELLTMDDVEARDLGFSRFTARNLEEAVQGLGYDPSRMVRLEQSWSESLSRLIHRFAPILVMIGLAALYTEFKAPGVGLPGVIGVLALGLVLFNQYLVGLAEFSEILLILLGMVLLAMEIFVLPGFGVVGLAGFFVIMVGFVLAFQGFVLPDPSFPWEGRLFVRNLIAVVGGGLVGMVISLMVLRYLLPRFGRIVEGPYLAENLQTARAFDPGLARITPGMEGVTLTMLRPAGKAEIAGEPVDVLADGEWIPKGERVVVSEVSGNRVVVIAARPQTGW